MAAARCDLLILGGGPAGLSAAIQVRQASPAVVLVVEAGDGSRDRVGETVPPDILVPLRRLGLADQFHASGHLPCPGSVSIWGGTKPGFNDFILNPFGPGWHLHRRRFEQMLADRAIALGAEFSPQTRFVGATCVDDGYEVQLRHGDREHRVDARWIVDATGAGARFARRQGARLTVQDRLVATVCFSEMHAGSFSSQTILEATQHGWWYAAQLPERRVLTMLVSDSEGVKELEADGFAVWKERLSSTALLAPRLAGCTLAEHKFVRIPILSSLLDPLQGERWLVVGDAASSYDPVSSQGIFKAMVDAEDAAASIVAALGYGKAPTWRYADRVRGRFQDYSTNRTYLYGLEQRWPESTFWSRRVRASAFRLDASNSADRSKGL